MTHKPHNIKITKTESTVFSVSNESQKKHYPREGTNQITEASVFSSAEIQGL